MNLHLGFRRSRHAAHARALSRLLDEQLPDPHLSVTGAMNKAGEHGTLTDAPAPGYRRPPSPPHGYPAVAPEPHPTQPPTQPFVPFGEPPAGPVSRPSGPQQQPHGGRPRRPLARVLLPLPPTHGPLPALPMLFGAQEEQIRSRQVAVALYRLGRVQGQYPVPDADAHPTGHAEEYAALMRRYDRITGTTSPLGYPGAWPVPESPRARRRMDSYGQQVAITAGPAS